MYRKNRNRQFGPTDFNQPIGLKMNPENRWVKKAELIPWDEIEDRNADLFPSHTGMPAKPLRVALGSLIIQKQYGYSDRELVEQIMENPYYQYFIGLHGYQQKAPYAPSLLVEFRKRLTDEILGEINEMIIRYNHPDDPGPGRGDAFKSGEEESSGNSGTLILDATCAPQNIAYCRLHGIRLSGPAALGRPKKDPLVDRKQEYRDAVDRIEVERGFSLAKRCFGLGLIRTKLDTTTRSSIELSIIAMNVDRLAAFSFAEFLALIFQSARLNIWWCPGHNITSESMGLETSVTEQTLFISFKCFFL